MRRRAFLGTMAAMLAGLDAMAGLTGDATEAAAPELPIPEGEPGRLGLVHATDDVAYFIDGVRHVNIVAANDIEGWADELTGQSPPPYYDHWPTRRIYGEVRFTYVDGKPPRV